MLSISPNKEAIPARADGNRSMSEVLSFRKTLRQYERFAHGSAANFVDSRNCYPLDLVEHAESGEDMVFGIGGIIRIAGLVKRSLDNEVS